MTTRDTIGQFKHATILVVGDVLLDLYIRGDVERISPEAPVPIITERSREYILGGAGNVARNVATLGGTAFLLGVLGNDADGKKVKRLCRDAGIKGCFAVDDTRPTMKKIRAVARRHQLLRIDREADRDITKASQKHLLRLVKRLPAFDYIVISDYAKGTVVPSVFKALAQRFGRARILVDTKPPRARLYRGVHAISPNAKEAYELSGIRPDTPRRAARAAEVIAKDLSCSVIMTRGEEGMTIHKKNDGGPVHIPSRALEVFDVTGAGDTVMATLALALATGADIVEAAEIANHAAGIVVGKEGTAAVLARDLMARFGV